jgi:ABC-type Fe3+ transport system permease subunit
MPVATAVAVVMLVISFCVLLLVINALQPGGENLNLVLSGPSSPNPHSPRQRLWHDQSTLGRYLLITVALLFVLLFLIFAAGDHCSFPERCTKEGFKALSWKSPTPGPAIQPHS